MGLILLATGGCDRSAMPYLGKWSGGFTVETAGPGTVGGAARNSLKGFLQLYKTEARYELHLEGEQFGLVAGGTWTHGDGKVTLAPTSVKVDDGGGEEARNPNRAWIDPAELSKAYSRPMSFRVSKDGGRMTGLLIGVGPLTGTHTFVREGFGR